MSLNKNSFLSIISLYYENQKAVKTLILILTCQYCVATNQMRDKTAIKANKINGPSRSVMRLPLDRLAFQKNNHRYPVVFTLQSLVTSIFRHFFDFFSEWNSPKKPR